MALQRRHHQLIRFFSLAVLGASLTYVGTRTRARADLTEEGLSQLTPATRELIESIGEDRPVTVHAFVSEEVPRDYVPVRARLLQILREMEASGGPGLTVRIVEPEMHSEEAEEAMENFGIMPKQLADLSGGRVEAMNTFLGVAFVSGPREETIGFLDKGLSTEYEVARALRVVLQEEKKVVGVLRTDATIMGNFDLQSRSQQPAWRIVDELRKQYEVRSLNPKTPIPEDVDVLFVPQLASLGQDELGHVKTYVDAGRPALLTVDPMPLFNVALSPKEPKLPPPGQGNNMFGQGPQAEPKGDYKGFLREIGVQWSDDRIVFDTHNPDPKFANIPPYIVFVSDRPDGTAPFQAEDPVVQGLSQVVMMFPGQLAPVEGHLSEFDPLLMTGKTAGTSVYDDMVQRHPLFGVQGPVMPRSRSPITGEEIVLAARIQSEGQAKAEDAKEEGEEKKDQEASSESKGRNVVVVADLDMFGDGFYQFHEQGGDQDGDGVDEFRFDNITFLLNVIDDLAGDDRFIELRKRKAKYRRLTRISQLTKDANAERQASVEEANKEAEAELEEAQKALEAAVAAIEERTDLDENTKAIMLQSAEATENRRLEAKTEKIEREKAKTLNKIETKHRRAVEKVESDIRRWAVLLPPIPALLMGAFIFARKRRREKETIPSSRRTGARPASTSKSKGDVA